ELHPWGWTGVKVRESDYLEFEEKAHGQTPQLFERRCYRRVRARGGRDLALSVPRSAAGVPRQRPPALALDRRTGRKSRPGSAPTWKVGGGGVGVELGGGDVGGDFSKSVWFGVGAPKATPAEIVHKLNREINAGLADPKLKARLGELGGTALALSPA